MPFSMTHLYVAKKLAATSRITNLSQFYLGSVAPDAVHYRQNYNSDYKKAAHLCVGEGQWGHFTNNNEWAENVVSFLCDKKDNADFDFYHGYCAHILTDIYNNISIWTRFRLEFSTGPEARGLYHFESGVVDSELYHSCPFREEIWAYLEASHGIDLPGLVFAEEVDRLRDDLLHSRYTERLIESSAHKIVTYDGALEFVGNALDYTVTMLKNVGI